MHKASPPIISANEATRCEFISAIIYGFASIFDGTVKVYPQYESLRKSWKGTHRLGDQNGRHNYSVTEAKREDINQGVAQSTVQAHASLQCNRKKRTYEDADLYEGAMYCIVSTGVDWVITKVQSGIGDGNDNGDGKVEVFFVFAYAYTSTYQLPIIIPRRPNWTYREIIWANQVGF